MAPRATPESKDKLKWDGSPTTKFTWFDNLKTVLDLESRQFRTLWEKGYLIDGRGRVITSSPSHSYHLQYDSVKIRPFENPNLCGTFTPDTADGLPLAVDPDAIEGRYLASLEILRAKDREIFTIITDLITNSRRRKDYESASGGSGTKLIKLLADELKTSSAEHGQYAARQMAALVEAGIAAPTVVAFDSFREAYQNWNAQLPVARRMADSVIADVYVAAAYNLGEMLHTRIELLLQQNGGRGDLDITVQCILEVLSKHELSAVGRAFKMDPKRSQKINQTPRVWIDGKDELCSVCDGKHDGGRHLRINCPSRSDSRAAKPKDTSTKPGSTTKGGAKLATGRLYPPLDPDSDELPETEYDCRLADLFSAGLDDACIESDKPYTNSEPPPTQTGSAFVARPAQTPTAPTNASRPIQSNTAQPTTTPYSLSTNAVKRLSELTALSPMREIRDVESELNTGVPMRTGGSDHRTRRDILCDMRATVGLPPLAVPFGIPIEKRETNAPESTITPVNATRARTSTSSPTFLAENPLAMTHMAGCPNPTGFSIECDSGGTLIHVHSFVYPNDPSTPIVFKHAVPFPPTVAAAPPRSKLLGRSRDGLSLFWGTPDGRLVVCPAHPTTPDASTRTTDEHPRGRAGPLPAAVSSPPTAAEPARGTRNSPARDATLALVSVIGTLAAMVIANAASSTPGGMHDPGELHTLSTAASYFASRLHIALVCPILLCVLTESIRLRQAKPGGVRANLAQPPCHYFDRTVDGCRSTAMIVRSPG